MTRRPPLIARRALLAGAALAALARPPARAMAAPGPFAAVLDDAAGLPRLHTLLVAQAGELRLAETFRGPGPDRPVNVKSVAKAVIAALVGIAIDRGIVAGVDQPVAALLGPLVPAGADPRVATITIEDLLTMRAGLERTSGANYGRWVASPDWVRFVLTRPFVDAPGGGMLYSTGSTHLLSAALTRASGRSTLMLARDWLGAPLGIEIPPWDRDPQGIYLGGNNMALAPIALLRLGELHRQGGVHDGRRVMPAEWIAASWTPRTRSVHTGHGYGYGWFTAQADGHPVHYAWGYGGQLLYVVPSLELTVVMTSEPTAPAARDGYVRSLHALLARTIMPAAMG